MTLLTKDQILAASDIKTEEVHVPEWGGTVRVSTMTGEARDRFESACVTDDGKANVSNVRAKLVASSIVDEDGRLMFTDADIEQLGHKSAAALDRVFEVAQRLSRVSASDVEDLAKN